MLLAHFFFFPSPLLADFARFAHHVLRQPGTIQGPITQHQPKIVPLTPSSTLLADVSTPQTLTNTPNLIPTSAKSTLPSEEIQETVYDLFEYVDLLSLCSPRVQKTDDVDSFISRYAVPDVSDDTHSCSVRILTWTGLISRQWIQQLLSKLMYVTQTSWQRQMPSARPPISFALPSAYLRTTNNSTAHSPDCQSIP